MNSIFYCEVTRILPYVVNIIFAHILLHCSLTSVYIHTGTGKGGECIWGGKFEDELRDVLKVGLVNLTG